MAVINLPIVGGAYKDPNTVIGCQSCINLYPEVTQGSEKTVSALLPTPAMRTLYGSGDPAKCRAMTTLSDGNLYAVYGTKLYKLDSAGFNQMPDVDIDGDNPVIVAENSRYACFISDSTVYTLDMLNNKWEQYGAALLYPADDVVTLAQRFIFNRRDTGQIFWTDTLSTNIDALSFATAEANPDNVTALKSHNKQLWIFGEESTEIWYSTGDKDLPFAPMQGTSINAGCLQTKTIQEFGGSLAWLSNTANGKAQVVITEGYQVQRISNHALEKELSSYDLTDASAYVYQENGHSFYAINIPKAQKTWVFDGATGLWHERAIFKDGSFKRHPAEYHAMYKGEHIFAHVDRLLLMGNCTGCFDILGDEVLPQVRERTTHAVSRTKGMIRHNRLTLIAQQATGMDSTTDPQVMLSWSDDDGVSWSDTRWRSLGKRGEHKKRTFWARLGASRNRAYRIRVTDAATLVITGAELEVN